MKIEIYPPGQQAVGGFDNGKITEQKPIGFPGEGSAVKRLGPLFYWAWFFSPEEGHIPSHPHQGFEIITYVMRGKAEHRDSMGTKSVVGAGGIQVMQTGSGVYHEERFIGPNMEGFQIWFEPHLKEAFKDTPVYSQFHHEDFPLSSENGMTIKTVIGKGSPVQLKTDILMWDIQIEEGCTYHHSVPNEYNLGVLVFRGNGSIQEQAFKEKDYIVLRDVNSESGDSESVSLANTDRSTLHLILIQVPSEVDYPLYPNR